MQSVDGIQTADRNADKNDKRCLFLCESCDAAFGLVDCWLGLC